MDLHNPYVQILSGCFIVILAYMLSYISKKSNISGALLLIALGFLLKLGLNEAEINADAYLSPAIELLGAVGLVVVILSSALGMKFPKGKQGSAIRALLLAILSISGGAFAISWLLHHWLDIEDYFIAFVYAVPLSVSGSNVIIPYIRGRQRGSRNLIIYENTFSGILGIALFYFLLISSGAEDTSNITFNVNANAALTLLLAVAISYILIWLLQYVNARARLTTLATIPIALYAASKLFHLSSLISITVFGIMLINYRIFFRGFLQKTINSRQLDEVADDFTLISAEAIFIVRTFFFVAFGMSLNLTQLLDIQSVAAGFAIALVIYALRFVLLKIVGVRKPFPEVFVAPRGLVSVLLFFALPAAYLQPSFNSAILFYTILFTSLSMTVALTLKSEDITYEGRLNFDDWEELDREIERVTKKKVVD